MKSTTAGFKTIMNSGSARNYLIKVDLTLADNTVLHLTEADIWEDSFGIETASSGTSSFDIGCAVIGKCTFTINNIDGDFDNYDFFNANAVVWLGIEGDTVSSVQQYYRMGFFTVDEPQTANGLISLELLDNMWKFDVPFSSVNITYPVTALSAVQSICTYCGVSLAGTSASFHGYNFSITQAPEDVENMNCREMLQYIAMIGCNFCCINPSGYLEIKWYDVNATASTTDVFDWNKSTSFGTEDIEITGVKFVIDDTTYSVGSSGYVLELDNLLVNADNVSTVLNLIWDVLDGFSLRTFNITTASDLAAEIGDKCKIKDYKGNYIYSWITTNSFKLANHGLQCNAEPPTRTLVKRYSQTVKAAVDVARQQTNEIISNYDLAVQMMNDLAVNAMGGYEDYEDLSTGGRVWYLSNMPITKVNNVCSFQPNSTVYKRAGTGFFVSRDGGTTWVNGYDMTTGELVVNVLDAIGINFDWARGGTLTLGGYGNGNGVLSIQDSSNVEKVHGDNTGVKVGSTSGSKIHMTTTGHLDYYYDNSYSGVMEMNGVNYGTPESPDIHDTLEIKEFDDIRVATSDDYSVLTLHNNSATGAYSGSGAKLESDGSVDINGNNTYISSNEETHVYAGEYLSLEADDGIVIDAPTIYPRGNTSSSSPHTITETVGVAGATNFLELGFHNGMICSVTQGDEVPRSVWHEWESGGTTYSAIILGTGVTQADFPSINTSDDYGYAPYIKCADNVEPPLITGTLINGTTFTVKFTAVTSAQAGSGQTSACVIKLLKTKGA